jgi:hypothetical protein
MLLSHASLPHPPVPFLQDLGPTEGGDQVVDQPPVLVISHPPAVVDLSEQEAQHPEGDLLVLVKVLL